MSGEEPISRLDGWLTIIGFISFVLFSYICYKYFTSKFYEDKLQSLTSQKKIVYSTLFVIFAATVSIATFKGIALLLLLSILTRYFQ